MIWRAFPKGPRASLHTVIRPDRYTLQEEFPKEIAEEFSAFFSRGRLALPDQADGPLPQGLGRRRLPRARPEKADSHRNFGSCVSHPCQTPGDNVLRDEAERRPAHTTPVACHRGDHGRQMRREGRLPGRMLSSRRPSCSQDAARVGFGGVGEIGKRVRFAGLEQVRLGHRHQDVLTDLDRAKTVGRQARRHRWVIVA